MVLVTLPGTEDAWLEPNPNGDLAFAWPIGIGVGPSKWYVECDRCGLAAGADRDADEEPWSLDEATEWAKAHNREVHPNEDEPDYG